MNLVDQSAIVYMQLLHQHKALAGSLTLGPKEIGGLYVLPGKVCTLLTDHLIAG